MARRVDGCQSGAVDFEGLAVDDAAEVVRLDDIAARKLVHLAAFLKNESWDLNRDLRAFVSVTRKWC